MAKLLYVGDCHATPDSIDEMKSLINLVHDTAVEHKVDGIVFLGDQFHTHATINVYVMKFWQWAIRELGEWELVFLVGNHDIPGKADAVDANAMAVYAAPGVRVIDSPTIIWGVVFAPHFHDKIEFESYPWGPPHRTLVCHQTFLGAQYENGFYDKDGAEQDRLPFDHIISGHIHKESYIGKVHYLGSPRWRTVDDANTQKFIWVIEHGEDGETFSNMRHIDTSTACTPIFHYTWKEGDETLDLQPRGHVTVDLIGSEPWVKEKELELRDMSTKAGKIRVRRFFVTKSAPKVRESDGLAKSFKKYVDSYAFPNKSDPGKIWDYIAPKVSWLNV